MINWTDIDNEVEEFQSGYRAGFVSIFKKYEGMETDERDGANRVIKVTISSFAKRYGIADTTFREWVGTEVNPTGVTTSRQAKWDKERAKLQEEAAAKATAEAEVRAAKALADAMAQKDRDAKEAMRQERVAAEARAKAEAAKIRAEEQAKAKAAAEKEIAKLRKDLVEAASKAEFDVSTMSEAQKAQVMTLLANDPEKASEWFKAQTAERSRKLAEAETKAKADAAKKREQMAEREARKAAEAARQDYEGSALREFLNLAKATKALQLKLRAKPITFDNVLTSGMSAQEWVEMTELVEDTAVEVRESLFSINAEQELFGING